jgi:hypothetical protein
MFVLNEFLLSPSSKVELSEIFPVFNEVLSPTENLYTSFLEVSG